METPSWILGLGIGLVFVRDVLDQVLDHVQRSLGLVVRTQMPRPPDNHLRKVSHLRSTDKRSTSTLQSII